MEVSGQLGVEATGSNSVCVSPSLEPPLHGCALCSWEECCGCIRLWWEGVQFEVLPTDLPRTRSLPFFRPLLKFRP